MKKYKLWIYIGFFAVLLAVFYAFVFKDYDFSASKLKVINPAVPEFSFTDQNGHVFNNKNTDNKVYVAEYFFTTCKGICPKMNANMHRIFDAYKDEPEFLIASHTCMPEVDSVSVLKAYEQKILNSTVKQAHDGSYSLSVTDTKNEVPSARNWFFLTGDKSTLYTMARQGYMIDNGKPDSAQQIQNQFIHTQFFALVDRYRRVRGIYDGLKEDEIQKLLGDIKGLLKEKVKPKQFMTGFSNSPG
ncbi:MAG: SCO1/SenC family lipoprotein [Ferruginibacter sp.]|nr:SCO1/SenC family lipoprotein [Ferruginibacter sp.]